MTDTAKRPGNFKAKGAKKPRPEQLQGTSGILYTFSDNAKAREATKDLLNLLQSVVVNETPASPAEEVEHTSLEEQLAAEVKSAKKDKDRFYPIKDLCRGVGYIRFMNKDDCPVTLVTKIFEKAIEDKAIKSRFLCKIIPVTHTVRARPTEAHELIKELCKAHFPVSEDSEAKPITWSVQYNERNNTEVPRVPTTDFIATLVDPKSYKVSINDPQRAFVVECNPFFFGVSICENWAKFKKYNYSQLGKSLLDD